MLLQPTMFMYVVDTRDSN